MAYDVSEAFVKQYESDVHLAYQRQGSILRNTVRTVNGVRGSTTTFQKFGTGEASAKSRHGTVTPMNPDHTNVECTLNDWYAGDYVDKLDELKINHDERMILAQTGAYALGRKTDAQIVVELDAAESGTSINRSALTLALVNDWVAALGARNVPMTLGNVFCAVSWATWSTLLTLPAFASQDYIGADMPYKAPAGTYREWQGVIWMPFTGLSGGTSPQCHMWHKTAIGHAIGADVSTDIWWNGERAAHFINNSMSMGAKLIDANGVVTRTIVEGA